MKPRNKRKHFYKPGNLLRVIQTTQVHDSDDFRPLLDILTSHRGTRRDFLFIGDLCLLLEIDRKEDGCSTVLFKEKKWKIFPSLLGTFEKV